MSRPMIHCPYCRRELYGLRRPQCLWCGARLTDEEFRQVALPLGTTPLPLPKPMPMLPPTTGRPWLLRGENLRAGILLVRIAVGGAVYVIAMLVRSAEKVWHLWHTSHLMPPGH